MRGAQDSRLEWRPTHHNSVCVFTTAVGEATNLLVGIEHNANWAVAHGCTFTLFLAAMAEAGSHMFHSMQYMSNWEVRDGDGRGVRRGGIPDPP